jgi:hypothetical protein
MNEVEIESIWEQTFLEYYLEKMRKSDKYSYIQTDYVDVTENKIHKMNKKKLDNHDLAKKLENTSREISKQLGFTLDV